MKTVAVTAALESERDRAAAFQPAWVIALNSADRKGRRSNSAQLDRETAIKRGLARVAANSERVFVSHGGHASMAALGK
ncbi:MAG: hypothetical protein EBU34_03835 [Alphaproteobacteria bacterium]|nr:hypothetical protein [Alphaproteobacteria bacterium]